ncbi:hypothetical protein ABVT39_014126, partial [Epinephelus coioides]
LFCRCHHPRPHHIVCTLPSIFYLTPTLYTLNIYTHPHSTIYTQPHSTIYTLKGRWQKEEEASPRDGCH